MPDFYLEFYCISITNNLFEDEHNATPTDAPCPSPTVGSTCTPIATLTDVPCLSPTVGSTTTTTATPHNILGRKFPHNVSNLNGYLGCFFASAVVLPDSFSPARTYTLPDATTVQTSVP